MVRIFSEENINKFTDLLHLHNWELELHQVDETDSVCKKFMCKLDEYYKQCFPLVPLSRSRNKDKPWVSKCVKISIRRKNKLYRKYIEDPSPENTNTYKKYKAVLDKCLKTAENTFYEGIFRDRSTSAKTLWTYFSPILGGKSKKGNKIAKLSIDNHDIFDSVKIADGLNDYFCNTGKRLAEKISVDTSKSYRKYLTKENEVAQSFYLNPVVESDVLEELLKLNPKKSGGPDGYTPKLVKAAAYSLAKPLAIIFNSSIKTAQYPSIFKLAKVTPIFKSGAKCQVDNYRPISLLNCFDKILERLIHKQLMTFLKKHRVLYIYQYGFQEGFSTIMALTEIIDGIKKALDDGDYVIGLYLDLKKAFETIDHAILLDKLTHYGIRGHTNLFFRNYLSDRKQYVHCNGTNSKTQAIHYGVPQGSVLGPLLFLVYINDIMNCVDKESLKLFADDTSSFVRCPNLDEAIEKTKANIMKLTEWFKCNKLTLNILKTCYSIFHTRKRVIPGHHNSIKIGDITINRTECAKYLGIWIDETLTWKHHIQCVKESLLKYFGIFYKTRHQIPAKFRRQVYLSYIQSRIHYGIELYGTASQLLLGNLQIMMNKLLKVLYNKDRYYRTNDLFRELNVLKLNDLSKLATLKLVHKFMHTHTDEMFENYFVYRQSLHQLGIRNRYLLNVPRTNKNMAATSIKVRGAQLWNNIEQDLRQEKDPLAFKRGLFHKYISSYN